MLRVPLDSDELNTDMIEEVNDDGAEEVPDPAVSTDATSDECHECHERLASDDDFCSACGTSVVRCGACRSVNAADAGFCESCGTAIVHDDTTDVIDADTTGSSGAPDDPGGSNDNAAAPIIKPSSRAIAILAVVVVLLVVLAAVAAITVNGDDSDAKVSHADAASAKNEDDSSESSGSDASNALPPKDIGDLPASGTLLAGLSRLPDVVSIGSGETENGASWQALVSRDDVDVVCAHVTRTWVDELEDVGYVVDEDRSSILEPFLGEDGIGCVTSLVANELEPEGTSERFVDIVVRTIKSGDDSRKLGRLVTGPLPSYKGPFTDIQVVTDGRALDSIDEPMLDEAGVASEIEQIMEFSKVGRGYTRAGQLAKSRANRLEVISRVEALQTQTIVMEPVLDQLLVAARASLTAVERQIECGTCSAGDHQNATTAKQNFARMFNPYASRHLGYEVEETDL